MKLINQTFPEEYFKYFDKNYVNNQTKVPLFKNEMFDVELHSDENNKPANFHKCSYGRIRFYLSEFFMKVYIPLFTSNDDLFAVLDYLVVFTKHIQNTKGRSIVFSYSQHFMYKDIIHDRLYVENMKREEYKINAVDNIYDKLYQLVRMTDLVCVIGNVIIDDTNPDTYIPKKFKRAMTKKLYNEMKDLYYYNEHNQYQLFVSRLNNFGKDSEAFKNEFMNDFNKTLLILNCQKNKSIELFDFILENTAGVYNVDNNDNSALNYTMFHNSIYKFNKLFNNFYKPFRQSKFFVESFYYALRTSSRFAYRFINAFTGSEHSINKLVYNDYTPLIVVVKFSDDYNIIDEFIKEKESSNQNTLSIIKESINYCTSKKNYVIHYAVRRKTSATNVHITNLRKLILAGVNVNVVDSKGYTPLMYAIKNNNKEQVNMLLNANADVNIKNNDGETAVDMAKNNNMDLENLKNTPSETNETSLIEAVNNFDVQSVLTLLEQGCNINERNKDEYTPLMLSIMFMQKEIFNLLLSKGADVNLVNYIGTTPLMLAVQKQDVYYVKALLKHKADINKQNYILRTALMFAINNSELIELLINSNADLNKQDDDGNTALMLAVINKHETVTDLLKGKPDVNIQNKSGDTALIIAARNNDMSSVMQLLDNGADIQISNKESETALDVSKDHIECNELIKTYSIINNMKKIVNKIKNY